MPRIRANSLSMRAAITAPALAMLLAAHGHGAPVQAPAASLDTIWTDGTLLQDRNGDGVTDFVAASFVLGDTPSVGEIAAAADVAARLGHETLAMDLPVSTSRTGVVIAIGSGGVARAGATVDVSALTAGQGMVAMAEAGGRVVVAITGRDDDGTRAAAQAFAGRLPFAGDAKGATLADVLQDVRKALESAGAAPASLGVASVVAAARADGFERLNLRAAFPSGTAQTKARRALAALRPAKAGTDAALSYPGTKALRIELTAPGVPMAVATLARVTPAEPTAEVEPPARRPGAGAKEAIDLSSLYENAGLLGDSDSNLIPDRVDTVLSPAGEGIARTMDVAARLGLESTGISVPLVVPADRLGKAESQPTLLLIGASHPLVQQLQKAGKYSPPELQPGEGVIQVVRKAFGEKSAIVVAGADAAGLDRALAQLAERLPHIWARGKDRTTIGDVEENARRFLAGRTPAGQAALAVYKLRQLGDELKAAGVTPAKVHVSIEKPEPGLLDVLKREAAAAFGAPQPDVSLENRDVQHAQTIFDDEFDIGSEVDDLRALVQRKVLPAVSSRKKQPVVMQARLSEPPQIRRQLETEIKDQMIKAGASDASVTILSAYKQGYSWVDEIVKPALKGKPIDRISIRFAKAGPPPDWQQQATYAPTRWLLELYPIAEVLARDLQIPAERVVFEEAPIGAPTYEVAVTGQGGTSLYRGTFEPKFVVRQFFDQFVDYEKVRVTTGWLDARVGTATVADERIVTDVEKFWDHFQSKTLKDIYAYMMRVHKGKPRAEDAPYFGELRVDLALSEPDYQLGIDQEQITSLESVQEEIYFNTLHYFDLMGRYTRSTDLDYPGRVIPIMHPKADGKGGHAKITFTGFAAPRPRVLVTGTRRNQPFEISRDIPRIAVERPEALGAVVRAGKDGIARLDLRVKVDAEHDERAALVLKYREDQVDRQMISADQVKAVVGALASLRAGGLYRDALSYHDLGEIRIHAGWTLDVDPKTTASAALQPNGQPEPWPDIRKFLPAGYKYNGERLVQWDEPMPPDEAYAVLARMSTFKEATVYKVGESYLGRDIWAMDLMPPIAASHWSQAKATTLKPTVIYSARQHANEVSSTSHTLRLAELLLTDPEYRKKLNVANAVFHPITNPDGAQLAYDMQKITPHYMLHPGYLGSLGVDATSGGWDPDPIYPESKVRPEIWRTWLPDIFLNPHGYPSHEWVQLFSEYAAWIRNRIGESRDYWTMRGWWMPGFSYIDDPKYPRNKAAQESLRKFIAQRMHAQPDVKALNERSYARYQRYTTAFDTELFKVNFTDGVLIYGALKGQKGSATSQSFMARQPNITIFDGSTEAPDETAHGDWMKLVATAGLTWDTAMLDWLIAQPHKVDRTRTAFSGGTSLTMTRPRPPKPPEKDERTTSESLAGKR